MADTKTRPGFSDATELWDRGYQDVCEVPDRRLVEFLDQRHDEHTGPLVTCRDAVCDALARFGGER